MTTNNRDRLKTDKPYTIERSDLLGRYLVTSRDIKAGEVILKESASVIGPKAESMPICLGCYRPLPSNKCPVCSQCRVAPVCRDKCGDHTETECRALQSVSGRLDLVGNSQAVLPLRCLLLRNSDAAKWNQVVQLESHTEQRRDSPIWKDHQQHVVQVLRGSGLLGPEVTDDLVQRICGAVDVNCFELRGPTSSGGRHDAERIRGVFTEAALMAHDCIGNTHIAVDDTFQMTIHASVAIPRGRPIYFNYTSAVLGTNERQEHLREGKYFDCCCSRCLDSTELGTHMSSVRCARCTGGLTSPMNPAARKGQSKDWKCNECGHLYRPHLMNAALMQARTELEDVDRSSPREMEHLLKRFLWTFPPNHSVLLELKQNLVALYRDIILREPTPSRKILQRKIDLCRDLLPLLEVIEPGISRLRGIALYELHVPMVMLANREYQIGDIKASELRSRLQDAERYLRDAVSQLLYEPPHTPEGHLARVAMQELKGLRLHIQEVEALADTRGKPTNDQGIGKRTAKKRNKK